MLWAAFKGRLLSWQDVPWPLLAAAGAALAAHVVHVLRLVAKPMASGGASPFGSAGEAAAPTPEERSQSKRIKVMADYDCDPLWALDEELYGDIAPELMGLSPELTRDLNAWAEAYTSSLNREDPGNSLWSEEQHRAHERAARPLAVRLARERPDLTVYVLDGATGVVEVRADEEI